MHANGETQKAASSDCLLTSPLPTIAYGREVAKAKFLLLEKQGEAGG